ncbi:hypothetical protein AB0M36_17775 [Actinoplanes sp. NPDC051346]|uniref:hypothetical protein n=1 Tax=Actinoplanes sp. NPDC051346 TaxID=3155048 RepID=UPI00341FA373
MKPLLPALASAALAVVLLLSACGAPATDPDFDGSPDTTRPTTVTPRPDPTTAVTTPPTTVPARPDPTTVPAALPATLVGSWVSTGEGNAEMIYEFDADGTYRYAGVLMQQRPSGLFSFEVGAAGTARATRTRITLRPQRGTQTLKDPDSPDGGWQRPADTTPKVLRWRMSGDKLLLTDDEDITVTYRRQ